VLTPPDYGWWHANPAVPAALRSILDATPSGAELALAHGGKKHA
jgi:hypothetical protein